MKKNLNLPDIEKVCEVYHEKWMDGKKAASITSRKTEDGEELMVPYNQLSDKAKEYIRNIVNNVYNAIEGLLPEETTQQEVGATAHHSTL